MKSRIYLFNTACIVLISIFSSCHTSRQAVASRNKQPKFIDDIYMNRHEKSNKTVSGTPRHDKAAEASGNDKLGQESTIPENMPALSKKEMNSLLKKYAELLGVKPKEIDNHTLYEFIDEWYGVSYHLGGSDQSGIDCSAFAKKLYNTVFGMDLPRTAAEQYSNCKRIRHSSEANEGDLVFFHVHSRHITHVGIYLMNDYFVHASSSQGVVISNLNDEYWHKYYAGIGRVKK